MHARFTKHQILLLGLFLVLMATAYGTADTRNGTIGDAIPLSGTAPGYDMVYLFMTGPGVPANGARMDNSNLPVVTGEPDTFTQVPVAGDSSWSYTWQTGRVSGGLAAGMYTIYAATQPAAKNALAGVAYSNTEIYLSRPVTTGTFVIQSDPSRGEVTINSKYFGNTPLTQDMAPGTYQITVSLEGYVPASGMYTIDAGETKQISVKLEPHSPLTSPSTLSSTISQETKETADLVAPTTAPLPGVLVIVGMLIGLALTVCLPRR
jgi:PEGA domain